MSLRIALAAGNERNSEPVSLPRRRRPSCLPGLGRAGRAARSWRRPVASLRAGSAPPLRAAGEWGLDRGPRQGNASRSGPRPASASGRRSPRWAAHRCRGFPAGPPEALAAAALAGRAVGLAGGQRRGSAERPKARESPQPPAVTLLLLPRCVWPRPLQPGWRQEAESERSKGVLSEGPGSRSPAGRSGRPPQRPRLPRGGPQRRAMACRPSPPILCKPPPRLRSPLRHPRSSFPSGNSLLPGEGMSWVQPCLLAVLWCQPGSLPSCWNKEYSSSPYHLV